MDLSNILRSWQGFYETSLLHLLLNYNMCTWVHIALYYSNHTYRYWYIGIGSLQARFWEIDHGQMHRGTKPAETHNIHRYSTGSSYNNNNNKKTTPAAAATTTLPPLPPAQPPRPPPPPTTTTTITTIATTSTSPTAHPSNLQRYSLKASTCYDMLKKTLKPTLLTGLHPYIHNIVCIECICIL